MRAPVLVVTSSLLFACAAVAQDAPFRLEEPFGAGERWALREELVTREVPLGYAEDGEGQVARFAWTQRAEVLDRARGFALRVTLESFRMESRGPNVETRVGYDAEDLRALQVGRGEELPLQLTWTFEYDAAWTLLDVAGQEETLSQLYDRMLADVMRGADEEGRNLGAWFAERAKPFVVDRWSRSFEDWQKAASNQAGAPVRAVMARLRGGEAIEPGAALPFEAAGDLPAGAVRYVGREDGGARFRVAFDDAHAEERPAPEYSFLIDDAGRLVRLESASTKVEGERRVATQYRFALEGVEPHEHARPKGVDTGLERDPRAEPF